MLGIQVFYPVLCVYFSFDVVHHSLYIQVYVCGSTSTNLIVIRLLPIQMLQSAAIALED